MRNTRDRHICLYLIHGEIEDYRCERTKANFFFAASEKSALGMSAVAAAAVGASGVAMGTAIAAGDMNEEADYVELCVNGHRAKGWLWSSPFKRGDQVSVVVQRTTTDLEIIAMTRPSDRMIALYPHLSRGRRAHVRNAIKWWAIGSLAVGLFVPTITAIGLSEPPDRLAFLEETAFVEGMLWGSTVLSLIFLAFTVWAARRWMVYVETAEKVFRALGWSNVEQIDLPKISKNSAKGDEPFGYGHLFFRY